LCVPSTRDEEIRSRSEPARKKFNSEREQLTRRYDDCHCGEKPKTEIGEVMNNPNQQNPGQQQGGQDKPGQQQGGGQQKPGQQQQEPGKGGQQGGQGGQRQGGEEKNR
jgi:hypothetical protein